MKYSAMLVAVGAFCAGTAFAQESIRIGVLSPLTGDGAAYGVPAIAGHQGRHHGGSASRHAHRPQYLTV